MILWLWFRQQSEAELPMPMSKEGMSDLGSSVSQDTFSTECELTAHSLLGVTGQGDSGQHLELEAHNPSAQLQVRLGHRNIRHHI